MKIKTTLVLLLASMVIVSCGKKKCVCVEKEYSSDIDKANQKTGSDTEKAAYTYKIGEKAMTPEGVMIEYTKEYIEQQKSELEATGKFYCEWKY